LAAYRRQQPAEGRYQIVKQQTPDSRQEMVDRKRQTADSRLKTADSRQQTDLEDGCQQL
jgi:hypothetical protein